MRGSNVVSSGATGDLLLRSLLGSSPRLAYSYGSHAAAHAYAVTSVPATVVE